MAKGESRNTDIEFSTVGKVSLNVSLVSSKKLNELLTLAYSKFYISFFRILRIWRIAPRKLPLFENFWEVLKVVFLRKELFCAKKRI
jgi:hypothetical protein